MSLDSILTQHNPLMLQTSHGHHRVSASQASCPAWGRWEEERAARGDKPSPNPKTDPKTGRHSKQRTKSHYGKGHSAQQTRVKWQKLREQLTEWEVTTSIKTEKSYKGITQSLEASCCTLNVHEWESPGVFAPLVFTIIKSQSELKYAISKDRKPSWSICLPLTGQLLLWS